MKKYLLSAIAVFTIATAKAQWLQQDAGFIKDTLGFYEISIPDKNTAWAVCYDGKGGLTSGRTVLDFTRTLDGGNTWMPGKMGNDSTIRFSNISAIDGLEAWVAMHKIGPIPFNQNVGGSFGKGGGIYHTIDGGLTWEHTTPDVLFDNNSVPRFVHFKDKNHGIAVGDPNGGYFEIYLTNNKGKKWKRVSQDSIPAPLANEVGWISGHYVIGNTIWFGTNRGRMFKSTDYGKSWEVHTVDAILGAYVNEVAFLDDALTGVAHLRTSTRTYVFSTTDGGLTWTNYFQPANWKNSRMTAVPGTTAFVSTSVNSALFRGSAISYDAGKTWTELERNTSKAACRFLDAETGYAGAFFVTGPPRLGGIFKSQIVFQLPAPAAKTSISKEEISSELVKVYPSPAREVVNIALPVEMMKSANIVRLITTDGKIIETKRTKAANLVQFNTDKLSPGMYIVHIQSGPQTITKTIAIVR